jgi:hypothetical protein
MCSGEPAHTVTSTVTHITEITHMPHQPTVSLSHSERISHLTHPVREVDAKAFHRRQRALVQASVLLRPSPPRSRFDRAG